MEKLASEFDQDTPGLAIAVYIAGILYVFLGIAGAQTRATHSRTHARAACPSRALVRLSVDRTDRGPLLFFLAQLCAMTTSV